MLCSLWSLLSSDMSPYVLTINTPLALIISKIRKKTQYLVHMDSQIGHSLMLYKPTKLTGEHCFSEALLLLFKCYHTNSCSVLWFLNCVLYYFYFVHIHTVSEYIVLTRKVVYSESLSCIQYFGRFLCGDHK